MSKKLTTHNSQFASQLVVIVGETASGKSALGMELAQIHYGEIICADSRTVYKGMDIGTAKPSLSDQKMVKHHLLDEVLPSEKFNVAEFKRLATVAIKDISGRGKLPIMVGGTGLYIDSILFDFQFRKPANIEMRKQLENMTVEELHTEINKLNLEPPNNPQNPRHLIRTIEASGELSARSELRANTLVLGLSVESEVLKTRIHDRIIDMVELGLADEVAMLASRYPANTEALQAPGYKSFMKYIASESSLEEVTAAFEQYDLRLAKRQRTWFRRNKSIQWISDYDEAKSLVQKFLSNQSAPS